MTNQEMVAAQFRLLASYRSNLQLLLSQASNYGGEKLAPLNVVNGIRDQRDAIRSIKQSLRKLNIKVDDDPNDEPWADPAAAPQKAPVLESPTTDFVIITALREERDAVLAKLPSPKRVPPSNDDVLVYYSAQLPVNFSDESAGSYRVVVTTLIGMGRVQATNVASAAIRRWKPRFVLLVGIAGGVATNRVQLGDVIIAEQIVDYELQKQTEQRVDIRWQVHNVDPRLLAAAQNMADVEWQQLIGVERPRGGKPKSHFGPVASGDKVVAYEQGLASYRETWSKLLGVEMEAGGAALAAFQAASATGFFMVRGVSDLADSAKGSEEVEQWRPYACDVAASYIVGLLQSGPVVVSSGN